MAISTCPSAWPPSPATFPVMVTGSCASAREVTDSQSAAAAHTLRTFKCMDGSSWKERHDGLPLSRHGRGKFQEALRVCDERRVAQDDRRPERDERRTRKNQNPVLAPRVRSVGESGRPTLPATRATRSRRRARYQATGTWKTSQVLGDEWTVPRAKTLAGRGGSPSQNVRPSRASRLSR